MSTQSTIVQRVVLPFWFTPDDGMWVLKYRTKECVLERLVSPKGLTIHLGITSNLAVVQYKGPASIRKDQSLKKAVLERLCMQASSLGGVNGLQDLFDAAVLPDQFESGDAADACTDVRQSGSKPDVGGPAGKQGVNSYHTHL
jgi:hypothetical protein